MPPPAVVGGWVPAPDGEGTGDGDAAAAVEGAGPPARRVPVAAAAAALVLAAVLALVVWLRSAGEGQVVDVPPRSPGAVVGLPSPSVPQPSSVPAAVPSAGPAAVAGTVVVDVEGRVRRPGLVRLPPGSRVADAVRSAGGAAPGAVLARLNLARVLVDGEQLIVPGPGDPVPAPGAAPPAPAAPTAGGPPGAAAPLDLNAAGQDALDALPGVGPVLAARIVAWRTQHGRFSTVDELGEVPGIGPKALERLRPLVRV